MAYYTPPWERNEGERTAFATSEASQDNTVQVAKNSYSQRELMDQAGMPKMPILPGDPDSLVKAMDTRRDELNQVIEDLERKTTKAKSELRMVQAAIDSFNQDVPEPSNNTNWSG